MSQTLTPEELVILLNEELKIRKEAAQAPLRRPIKRDLPSQPLPKNVIDLAEYLKKIKNPS